jgi:hypothetical protein
LWIKEGCFANDDDDDDDDGMTLPIVWEDNRNVNMLTNMHRPISEGNFCNEHRNALKPVIVQDCNRHMRYVEESDRMTNTYCIVDGRDSRSKTIFLSPGYFRSEQVYLPHLLFKIITQAFQNALVRDLRMNGGSTAHNSAGKKNPSH